MSPNSLQPLATPQTQRIVISGSGFGPAPTLHFVDTFGKPYDRTPTPLQDGSLEYYVKVGTDLGQWTVQVVNNGVASDPYPFTVGAAAAAPTITPPGGNFTAATQVTLATATAGATIRYTTDGTDPTASSPAYGGPFTLNGTALVKARAFKPSLPDSAVTSATFTINTAPAAPVISAVTPATLQPVFGLQDVVVTGTGFVPGSELRFYDPSGNLRQNDYTLYFNPGHLEYQLNVLALPGTWTVKVVNSPGGQESNLFSFTVQGFPTGNAPTPLAPASGTTGLTAHPTLKWSAVPGAQYYRVMVAKSAAGLPRDPNGVLDSPDGVWVTSPSVTEAAIAPPVIAGQTYYWQVQASINGVPNGWSPIWTYTMAGELNVPPVVGGVTVTPASVVQGQPVTFIASGVYDVNVGNTVKWVEFVRESNGIPGLQVDGANTDTQMGIDFDGSDGWTATGSTFGLAAGEYTVYALAADTLSARSAAVATTMTVTPASLPAPQLLSATYVPGSVPPTLRLTFNVDVGRTLNTGTFILAETAAFASKVTYDATSNTATVQFPGGRLGNGRYTLNIPFPQFVDNAAGATLQGPVRIPFFELAGDANRDQTVNFADLLILAKNYNRTGLVEWSDGDFNGDGFVNFADLLTLAKNYNTSLLGPPRVAVTVGQNAVTDAQPTPVDFGSAQQGAAGPSLTFTVTNAGEQPLTLGTPTLPAGFVLTDPLSATLAPGATDSFTVQLSTAAAGTPSGAITFTTNDPAHPTFSIPVTGTVGSQAGPTALADKLGRPDALRVAGGYVYFTDNATGDGVIKRVPVGGGPVETVLTGATLSDAGTNRPVSSYSVAGGSVYGAYGGYVSMRIFAAAVGGASPVAPAPLADNSGGDFLAVTGGYVYYASGFSTIRRVPVGGGSPADVLGGYWARSAAADDTTLYFVDYNTKSVMKYPLGGSSATTLVGGNASEGSIFLDAANVYLNIDGMIKAVPKAGGAVATLVNTGTATGYASDGAFVYYVDGGSIRRVPVGGGASVPVAAAPASGAVSVAVDGAYVYWADNSGGAGAGKVWRLAKSEIAAAAPAIAASNTSVGTASSAGSVLVAAATRSIPFARPAPARPAKLVRQPGARPDARAPAKNAVQRVVPAPAAPPMDTFSRKKVAAKGVAEVLV